MEKTTYTPEETQAIRDMNPSDEIGNTSDIREIFIFDFEKEERN